MKDIQVFHYDAFATIPNQGNPAGVVLEANHLSKNEMQEIAKRVGFNETVFVTKSERADLRLNYFTPGHEIPLCGHATIASIYALKRQGLLPDRQEWIIETNIGLLPITCSEGEPYQIKMKQGKPEFIPFGGDREQLFKAIGLCADDWDERLPIVYGSTGTWTLLVPVKKLSSFAKMVPSTDKFPAILKENPRASIHPFCLDAYDSQAHMHARHFSSPYSGTIEDPITGTASGVMGAYYLTYIKPELNEANLVVEQGQELNRDGKVSVEAKKLSSREMDIFISGTAVWVGEIDKRILE
ncbi:PhzF family phenazine biosynthesis protein [Paenibacillus sp. PL91]|uniref:PhzF family phenazine biosynthesis protein n=1 Tax=Paenibacillus sp. PL91 TaxID=2729538 RepID=UPI00145E1077|nr:PhzF family phenazine biosynthesis isomerase [Paenibacillus sp. PL91]MBC9199049.1 PhzF family phenazine biosynthesis isomerase [Paenibacillus sp. PL91]